MYRLTVVAGPNRGTSYPLHEGETTVGRLSANSIVLNSSKVSKRHCVLVVTDGDVVCKDQGSSNGTFVNGVLSRTPRQVRAGDRITVGDFVFELSRVQVEIARDPLALPAGIGGARVRPASAPAVLSASPGGIPPTGMTGFSQIGAAPAADAMPREFKARMLWLFERRVMPHLYRLLLKYEWRTLVFSSYLAFAVVALVFGVAPLVQSNDAMILRELERRARFMAQQVVETNIPYILQKNEAKAEISESVSRGYGVRQAFLMSLDNRVIAPGSRLNQYVTDGPAAIAVVKVKQEFENGRMRGIAIPIGTHTVVAAEPMMIFSPKEGRNIPVALGVVALDATLATQGLGDVFVVFGEAFIWLASFGLLFAVVIYRLTLKPLEILNDDIDAALKGESFEGVGRDCKFEEIGQLQDVVESILRRATSGAGGGEPGGGRSETAIGDECLGTFRHLGGLFSGGLAFCDGERRALFLNASFEDLTGIRSDNAYMQNLPDQARDQAFTALMNDLFDRSSSSPDGASEDFEFSGVSHRVQMVPIGESGAAPRGFILTVSRSDHG